MAEVITETDEYTITRTISVAGFADTVSWKPGSAEANREAIIAQARAALKANATYLAIASPTQAQAVAQVERLTRECSALLRLVLDDLSTIADT